MTKQEKKGDSKKTIVFIFETPIFCFEKALNFNYFKYNWEDNYDEEGISESSDESDN